VIAWNPAAEQIFGYTREVALGRQAGEFSVSEEARPLFDQARLAKLSQGDSVHHTVDHLTGSGRRITCEWFSAPLVGATGQTIGLVSLVQDISERQRVAAEREKLIAELENRNAELERFVYTVSHDLKSPLITIQGFLGFLMKDALAGNTERLTADIKRISAAAEKMQQLLNDLLELSRVGRMMNQAVEVPFEEVVRDALDMLQGRLATRPVRVDIITPLPRVYGDRVRLVEVMQNLIDNAVKFAYAQPDPRIEIGVRETESAGQPIFFVRDNGLGIEPQYHERVFGLFNKLDAQSEGTGVGLALVKRIVEVHGGRIWVESAGQGHGSTFCFTLAARDEKVNRTS
jgi:PAS domain S-box-containing protein